MSVVKILGRIITALVLLIAIFLGWLRTYKPAYGVIFATVSPLLEGYAPPLLVGHGRMTGTEEIPDDMMPSPRPENELFASLPGGYKLPLSGIGMCCRATAYDDVLVRRTILWYLLQGGRHIDTAHVYRNHKAIGLGIKDAIERGIPRSEIFLVTKLFPPYYGYQSTLDLVPTFLDELEVDYIDLVLMHAPKMPLALNDCGSLSDKECRQVTWKALSELKEKGIMRNIGVSNVNISQLEEIKEVKGGAPIANLQMQYNAFVPPKQHETFDFCMENDISVTAYTPVGGVVDKSKANNSSLIADLSSKYGKSTYQILLRWVVQKGAAVIPGTGNPSHMKDNLDVYSWSLSDEDMERMIELRSSEEAKKMMYFDMSEF